MEIWQWVVLVAAVVFVLSRLVAVLFALLVLGEIGKTGAKHGKKTKNRPFTFHNDTGFDD